MKLIATASSDATVRIYKNRQLKSQQQFYHKYTIKQREELEDSQVQGVANTTSAQQIDSTTNTKEQVKRKTHRLFLDDTEYTSFVRRLSWSPDG